MITSSTIIATKFGSFKVNYHRFNKEMCVSFSYGNIAINTPIVRIHSACLFGEVFSSLHCDCRYQIDQTMKAIVKNGSGIIIYSYQEGRGIGLENKIKAMETEREEKCDTVEAFKKLGFDKLDYRTYKIELLSLEELNLSRNIILFSGNPIKRKMLENKGFRIVKELEIKDKGLSQIAIREKKAKKQKMGYNYKI